MTEREDEQDFNNNSEIIEEIDNVDENEKENDVNKSKKIKQVEIELKANKTQRSDKTKFERAKDSKERAIEAFKHGQIDPEYRVVKMTNGKFRCYKRKEPLTPTPINVNQIQPNRQSNNDEISEPINKPKASKAHDPFSDIVYYNMSNQISEQLNKRLDAVNAELERLRHKNTKLKGKYKQLKQAIYITEEEEHDEPESKSNHNDEPEPEPQQQQIQSQPIQQQMMIQNIPLRRAPAINFNRFFN